MDRTTQVFRWSFFIGIILPILFIGVGTIYAQPYNGFVIGPFHVIHGQLCSGYTSGEKAHSSQVSDAFINLTWFDKFHPTNVSASLVGKTDENGFFTLFFPVYSNGELLITARKDQQEWMTMIEISARDQSKEHFVPIDFETTLATDLYLSALDVVEPSQVNYSDILNSIQSEASSMDFEANNTFSEVSRR